MMRAVETILSASARMGQMPRIDTAMATTLIISRTCVQIASACAVPARSSCQPIGLCTNLQEMHLVLSGSVLSRDSQTVYVHVHVHVHVFHVVENREYVFVKHSLTTVRFGLFGRFTCTFML